LFRPIDNQSSLIKKRYTLKMKGLILQSLWDKHSVRGLAKRLLNRWYLSANNNAYIQNLEPNSPSKLVKEEEVAILRLQRYRNKTVKVKKSQISETQLTQFIRLLTPLTHKGELKNTYWAFNNLRLLKKKPKKEEKMEKIFRRLIFASKCKAGQATNKMGEVTRMLNDRDQDRGFVSCMERSLLILSQKGRNCVNEAINLRRREKLQRVASVFLGKMLKMENRALYKLMKYSRFEHMKEIGVLEKKNWLINRLIVGQNKKKIGCFYKMSKTQNRFLVPLNYLRTLMNNKVVENKHQGMQGLKNNLQNGQTSKKFTVIKSLHYAQKLKKWNALNNLRDLNRGRKQEKINNKFYQKLSELVIRRLIRSQKSKTRQALQNFRQLNNSNGHYQQIIWYKKQIFIQNFVQKIQNCNSSYFQQLRDNSSAFVQRQRDSLILERIIQNKIKHSMSQSFSKIHKNALRYKEGYKLSTVLEKVFARHIREDFTRVYHYSLVNRLNQIDIGLNSLSRIFQRKIHVYRKHIKIQVFPSIRRNPWFAKVIHRFTVDAPMCYQTVFWKMKEFSKGDRIQRLQSVNTKNHLIRLIFAFKNLRKRRLHRSFTLIEATSKMVNSPYFAKLSQRASSRTPEKKRFGRSGRSKADLVKSQDLTLRGNARALMEKEAKISFYNGYRKKFKASLMKN